MSATIEDGIQALDNAKTAMDNLVAKVDAKQAGIDTEVEEAITEMNTKVDEAKSSLTIIATDGYRKAVEAATGGRNTVLYDDHGNPNIMVVVPRFTYDDLGMEATMGSGTVTAFLKDGQELPEIFIGKYLASGSQGLSVPGVTPKTSLNFDETKAVCQAKGEGWHLMTAHEWAAIAFWCVANGYQPRGNTQFGRAYDAFNEFGRRSDGEAPNDRAGNAFTYTGSGPASWSHDSSDAGICDLVGNVWEWSDLLKLVDGQVICTPDNDFSLDETDWQAQAAYLDSPIEGDGQGSDELGEPILSSAVTKYAGPAGSDDSLDRNKNDEWKSLAISDGYSPSQILKRLLVEPAGHDIAGFISCRNYGTRFPLRGSHWFFEERAGLAVLNFDQTRSYRATHMGFRPAYIAPTS